LPAPRRDIRSTPDGGSAVQPPGRSYTAHWEALGCALCLLTTTATSRTGPVWAWGFCPGFRRPRARVPLVVWAWDLFVLQLSCCGLPAPTRHQFFALRFATLVIKRICLSCRAHPSTTNLLDASARVLYMADGAANRVRVGLALLLLESHESEPRRIEPAKSNDLRCIGLPLTDRAPKKTTAAYDPPPPKTFTPSN
jgi:hypothetical protein